MIKYPRYFRVLHHKDVPKDCPKQILWLFVSACEDQAQINHQQTLTRLNERGGLDPVELWLLCHKLKHVAGHIPTQERATRWLKFLMHGVK